MNLWVGRELEHAARLLAIIAIGEFLPMTQWGSYSLILGVGRPRLLAVIILIEDATALALAFVLARPYGVAGICIAFALTGTLGRGVAQLVCACRLTDVSLRRYVARALLPPMAAAMPSAALLAALIWWRPPATWSQLFGYAGLYTVAYALSGSMLVPRDVLMSLQAKVYRAIGSLARRSTVDAPIGARGQD